MNRLRIVAACFMMETLPCLALPSFPYNVPTPYPLLNAPFQIHAMDNPNTMNHDSFFFSELCNFYYNEHTYHCVDTNKENAKNKTEIDYDITDYSSWTGDTEVYNYKAKLVINERNNSMLSAQLTSALRSENGLIDWDHRFLNLAVRVLTGVRLDKKSLDECYTQTRLGKSCTLPYVHTNKERYKIIATSAPSESGTRLKKFTLTFLPVN